MSRKKDTNRLDKFETPTPMNRRSILKAVGAAGVTTVGLSGISIGAAKKSEQEQNVEIPDITELGGQRRKNLIATIMSDPHTKKIKSEFEQDGWTPELADGKYLLVEPADEESYQGAVIPSNTLP